MQGIAVEKVPGGKLLRIKVDYDEKINSVKITGDFFLHPEEAVEEIEKTLVGLPRDENEQVISAKLDEMLQQKNATLIGIDAGAIARVLKQAMK